MRYRLVATKSDCFRADFCIEVGRNIIHGSDSVDSAHKEIALWYVFLVAQFSCGDAHLLVLGLRAPLTAEPAGTARARSGSTRR
jgi:hypothetical protein